MSQEDIFDQGNLSPREQVTDWVNIKKAVGDSVSGLFMGWWEVAAHAGFKEQLGIAIRQDDGKVFGVNLNDTEYFRGKLAVTQGGDSIGLRYEGDKDTGQMQPAKIIKFYNKSQTAREKDGVKSVGTVATEKIDADDDQAF